MERSPKETIVDHYSICISSLSYLNNGMPSKAADFTHIFKKAAALGAHPKLTIIMEENF
jgi:hypothetical protein